MTLDFRKMRRSRQQLAQNESISLLINSTSGTLALAGDNGYPYAVPMSHAYDDGKLYFHSAMSGHKIDAIRNCDKASFCVIVRDDVHPAEFTTYFKSIIAFGKIHIVESDKERMKAAELLAEKFNPGDIDGLENELKKFFSHMLVIRMDIEHLTGKEAIELTRNRAKEQL